MKISVCLKEVIDSSLNIGFGYVSPALLQKGLPHRLNPHDEVALSLAFSIKNKNPETEVSAIAIGPQRIEHLLKDTIAMGVDNAMRIIEEGVNNLSSRLKALMLARAISRYGADLILCGARSMDNASGRTGPLIAAMLGLPCICGVLDFQTVQGKNSIIATRNLSKGTRERVECPLPAVLAIEEQDITLPYASTDKLIESYKSKIIGVTIDELSITQKELDSDPQHVTGFSFPRPRPKKVDTPSSRLPAFDRILALLEGGIAKRRGEIIKGDAAELVTLLFELLIREEVIKPAISSEPIDK
ncbi:electron transfer flavoprotein subunit beta/FixA family protein [Chloroflexota bacterium]